MARRWIIAGVVGLVVAGCGVAMTLGAPRRPSTHGPVVPRSPVAPRSPTASGGLPSGPPAAPHAGVTAGNGNQNPPGELAGGPTGNTALPAGTWSLPAPTRYDGVAGVGYAPTTMGALGFGYSALAARYTVDPDVAVSVARATVLEPTTTFLQAVAQGTEALRSRFGLAPTGPTPTTIALSLIGCRVMSASESHVVAGYEGTLSVEGGAVQGSTAEVSVAIVLDWDGADWKIDPTADLPTPPIEFPTTASAPTPQGWHACSEV